jgi:WD40 repeat protein
MWKNVVIGSGEDQTIRLFDQASDSALPFAILSDHTGAVNCLFVHNDLLFSGGSDALIIQWNLTSLTLMMTLDGWLQRFVNN